MPEPKKHHLVPRWLLKRFSKDKHLVMAARDGSGTKHVSPKTAVCQTDFYAVEMKDGSKSYEVERFLARIELAAANAVHRIDDGNFPLSDDEKMNLALFMAFQMTRNEASRDALQQMYDHTLKMMMLAAPKEYVRSFMKKRNGTLPTEDELVAQVAKIKAVAKTTRIEPHKNEQIRIMLETAPTLAPYFLEKSWHVLRFGTPALLTGDHPIALWKHPDPARPWDGVGVGTADEIYFPLDPSTLLLLSKKPHSEASYTSIPGQVATKVNQVVARQCYNWIFHHPSHEPLNGIALRARAPMVISGLGSGDLTPKTRKPA